MCYTTQKCNNWGEIEKKQPLKDSIIVANIADARLIEITTRL